MKICWVLLKSCEFCSYLCRIFCLDLVSLVQIRWLFDFFCSDLVSLAQIRRRFDFFCLDLVSFAQIRRRSGKKYRSSPKSNLRQHFVGFNWPDRRYFQSDPTWPVGFCSRRRVVSPGTWCHRVSCGLGTDSTRTDSWTPLQLIYIFYKIDVRTRFGPWSKVWLDPSLTGPVQ